jgi:predicted DsbA family dithiol-disulfide isomerase
LEKLQQNYAIDLHWRAFLLRPAGSPPISEAKRAMVQANQGQLKERAQRDYGLEINPGPFGIDSLPAHQLAKFAESQGKGEVYTRAVLKAYWQQGRDISDQQVLAEIVEESGLKVQDLDQVLNDPQYKQAVELDLAQAQAYRLNGVPAMIFGDKYLIVGAQPYQLLQQAVEQVLAEQEGEERERLEL